MKEMVNAYINIINITPKQKEGDETSPEHLSWMLHEMLHMSIGGDKFCRWLGFVHFAMFERDMIEISAQDPFNKIAMTKDMFSKKFQPEPIRTLLTRYSDIIHSPIDSKKHKTKMGISHAKRMIEKMITMNFDEQSFHLHLGFIQCFMIINGFLTVNGEREQTRAIF